VGVHACVGAYDIATLAKSFVIFTFIQSFVCNMHTHTANVLYEIKTNCFYKKSMYPNVADDIRRLQSLHDREGSASKWQLLTHTILEPTILTVAT
jgi:hypothetical protein